MTRRFLRHERRTSTLAAVSAVPKRRRLSTVALPLAASRAGGQGLEFVGFVLLARHLGTGEFGQLSVAYLICRYAGIVADWGASLQGARDVAIGKTAGTAASIRRLVHHRYLVTAALVVVYVGATLALGYGSLAPLALCIAGRGLNRDWISLGRERGLRSGVPPLIQGVVVVAGAPFVYSLTAASMLVGLAWFLGTIASISLNKLTSVDAGDAPPGPLNPWFLILLVSDQIYASMDVMLLAIIANSSEAGIYAAAYRFPSAWITVIGLTVAGTLPGVSRIVSERPHELDRVRRKALKVGAAAGVAVLIIIPVSWLLLPLIFGSEFSSGRPALILLMMAATCTSLTAGLQPIYFALGSDRALAAWSSLVAVINVAMNIVVIPWFGATGAAAITLLSQALMSGFYFEGTRRLAHRVRPGHDLPIADLSGDLR